MQFEQHPYIWFTLCVGMCDKVKDPYLSCIYENRAVFTVIGYHC